MHMKQAQTDLTEEFKQIVERNLKLIDLHYGYNFQEGEKQKYEEQFNYVRNIKSDINKFAELCKRNGFITYIENIDKWKRIINRNNIVDIINRISINN